MQAIAEYFGVSRMTVSSSTGVSPTRGGSDRRIGAHWPDV
jgi:hypothetical protein